MFVAKQSLHLLIIISIYVAIIIHIILYSNVNIVYCNDIARSKFSHNFDITFLNTSIVICLHFFSRYDVQINPLSTINLVLDSCWF